MVAPSDFAADADFGGRPRTDRTDQILFWLGVAGWLAAMALTWPSSLSFGDEVGYVGEARLLLEGRVHPLANSPGVWVPTPSGGVAQYNLLLPLLIAPVLAVLPRAIFIGSILAAIVLCWMGSCVLRAWGRSPLWALIILAHPTIAILSRTVMADLMFALFAVLAWWSLGRSHRVATVLSFVGLIAIKPIGVTLAFALTAGEAARLWPEIRQRDARAMARIRLAMVAIAAGLVAMASSNLITTGRLWFGYRYLFLTTPPFWYTYLPSTGVSHLRSLLLNPPLLIAGIWPFWRRRDYGVVLLVLGMTLMMSFFFYVDFGKSALDSLVLSPRLILPAFAFLLIGYAECLAQLGHRIGHKVAAFFSTEVLAKLSRACLVLAPAIVAFGIGGRHKRWQEPMGQALAVATEVTSRLHVDELWLNYTAGKAGLLFRGRVRMLDDSGRPKVILCNSQDESYRASVVRFDCARPGYRLEASVNAFQVMVRDSD